MAKRGRAARTGLTATIIGFALLGAGSADAAQLSIGDATVAEDSGPATFNVTLSKKAKRTVTVKYATAPGTAGVDDYTPASGTLKIKRHKKKASLDVAITDDGIPEPAPDENFAVNLSHPRRATIGDPTGEGFITDDECAGSADTDADGIPDCADPCPSIANPAGPCPASIYSVKNGTVSDETPVAIQNPMVTAVSGKTAWVGVQPSDGGFAGYDNSGIEVDATAVSPDPTWAVGDRVNIEGTVAGGTIDATDVDVLSTGGTPAADQVDPLDFADESALDDVLVAVPDFQADPKDENGNWPVSGWGFTLGTRIFGSLPDQGFPSTPGAVWFTQPQMLKVTGIAEMGNAAELWPRTTADLIPGIHAFPGSACTVNNGTPQANRGVQLSGPALSDTVVSLLSSAPSVATVPASVTVPTGQNQAIVSVTPVSVGSFDLTATLGGANVFVSGLQVKNSCP